MTSMSKQEKANVLLNRFRQLKSNLTYCASKCMTIKNKGGQLVPFVFNKAQEYTHNKLEKQKRETGKVRAIILKGRQQGISTYVSARFFHKTVFNPGTGTFILSHQAKTTGPLFEMVKRYMRNFPQQKILPEVDASNRNQIKFTSIESEYTVGTAGNEDIGRGMTIKLLHCSESAWYGNTDNLETGLFQAVAELEDTEIIHESTANGMNNLFYRKAIDAMKGKGEYILIFVPWFWQDEYRTKIVDKFELSQEEQDLKKTYNLDDEQLLWRRNKIVELKDEWKFKQEYPMNAMEAFIVSGKSFISPKLLMEARRRNITDSNAPKILGLDGARTNDRVVWVCRQGRTILWKKVIPGSEIPDDPTIPLAEMTAKMIKDHNIDKVFADYGMMYGVIDTLRTWGYRDIVQGVYFGKGASDKDRFLNKRSEMAYGLKEWLEDGYCSIIDDDEYFADLLITPMDRKSPSGKIFLPPKEKIREDYGVSTDEFDATILTFAYPVMKRDEHNTTIRRVSGSDKTIRKNSELLTVKRISGTQSSSGTLSVRVDH